MHKRSDILRVNASIGMAIAALSLARSRSLSLTLSELPLILYQVILSDNGKQILYAYESINSN